MQNTQENYSQDGSEIGKQNYILASSLQHASMKTKLDLVQFVDRGMMTLNEVRQIV